MVVKSSRLNSRRGLKLWLVCMTIAASGLSCSSPNETTLNDRQKPIVWSVPSMGALLISDIVQNSGGSQPANDTFVFRGVKNIFGARIERFAYYQYPTSFQYFVIDSTGNITVSADSNGLSGSVFPTGGGSLHVDGPHDSIVVLDTFVNIKVSGYAGADYILSAENLVLCPHVIDSEFSVVHGYHRTDTIIRSSNYWFDPTHGGYYARTTQLTWYSQSGAASYYERNLTGYVQ